jgi:cytochrome c oxidase assembly protein subunit 11
MAVSFFIDPEVLKDRDAKTVRDMTLSYTFHKVSSPAAAAEPTPTPQRGAGASLAIPRNPG